MQERHHKCQYLCSHLIITKMNTLNNPLNPLTPAETQITAACNTLLPGFIGRGAKLAVRASGVSGAVTCGDNWEANRYWMYWKHLIVR